MARRDNVTGIKYLSIGTTKNDRGNVLQRYLINVPTEDGGIMSRSFYFGKNTSQIDAFFSACGFLRDNCKIDLPNDRMLRGIYRDKKHTQLIS